MMLLVGKSFVLSAVSAVNVGSAALTLGSIRTASRLISAPSATRILWVMVCCLLPVHLAPLELASGGERNKLHRRHDLDAACITVFDHSVEDVCRAERAEIFRDVVGLQTDAHRVTLPREGR